MSCYLVRTMKALNMMPSTWWIFDMLTDYTLAFSAFILGKNIVTGKRMQTLKYESWEKEFTMSCM